MLSASVEPDVSLHAPFYFNFLTHIPISIPLTYMYIINLPNLSVMIIYSFKVAKCVSSRVLLIEKPRSGTLLLWNSDNTHLANSDN